MTLVLALDQAPRTIGFAYGDGSDPPKFGSHENPDYAGNESALMDHVFEWLVTLGKSIGAEYLYSEQIVINAKRIDTNTLHKQFAVYDAVAFACGRKGLSIEHYEANISEWRVHFLGMGGAPKYAGNRTEFLKDLAMKECAARDLYPSNHHEAEAIGIWSFGLAQLDPAYRARSKWQQRRAESRRDEERRERAA